MSPTEFIEYYIKKSAFSGKNQEGKNLYICLF